MTVNEDVFITENGKTIARVVDARKSAVDNLCGLLKGASQDTGVKTIREEILSDYEDNA